MKLINEKLACDILEAGKKEFLLKGFQKASMRNIAASLNVTTGAIYRYYKDKETLFELIVKETADTLEQNYIKDQEEFSKMPIDFQVESLKSFTEQDYDWMIEYIYDNYDVFKLIACCSNGTKYENYVDRLISIEVKSSHILINHMMEAGLLKNHIDTGLIHIVVTAFFHGIFETIIHDVKREQAVEYMSQLRDFYSAGWLKILGLL
ncbi:TetR/AcrR family transcriptional regulator [uncultured Clostridium sp.]|uniref:TetR/AcrR family transcriptional regulator n=1 Tax=uncultured Clostridium sp. TaxID=59620 RepID=UPI0025D6BE2B|nr:TetR/AcrR family transcriptional regulator [uncultured Clostridium sp.]